MKTFTLPGLALVACLVLPCAAHAAGQQIYECGKDVQGAWTWLFKGPQADLMDDTGRKVGSHGAGPSWVLNDGSGLTGQLGRQVGRQGHPQVAGAWIH